jgi:hypothetical protein
MPRLTGLSWCLRRFFILTSMWLGLYYYVFGFLLLVFLILVITCAEITIVLCYFQVGFRWGHGLYAAPSHLVCVIRGSPPCHLLA